MLTGVLERDEVNSECASWSPPLFHGHSQEDPTEASENTETPGSSSNSTDQQPHTTQSSCKVKLVDYYGY